MPAAPDLSVVIGTRNRCDRALAAVARLRALPERPPVILVDDGSTDGTADAVEAAFPDVGVVRSPGPRGVTTARNLGVQAATTPFIAFCDDDSGWAPGSLARAVAVLTGHPRLGAVAARIAVGDDGRVDPVCRLMAASPLPSAGLPGPKVLGFVACGAVVRREAYRAVGGFAPEYVIGGEEEPLALALASAGWDVAYVEEVVATHAPDLGDHRDRRDRNATRNDLWTAWRYRRPAAALRRSWDILSTTRSNDAVIGAAEAFAALPRVLRERRPVPARVEAQRRLLGA